MSKTQEIDRFNKNIDQFLENMKKLRDMSIIETVQLPKVIVIGDEHVGKSSLLSSLFGLVLPSCTRLPLVIKIQNNPIFARKLTLHHQDISKVVGVDQLAAEIDKASEIILDGKCFSDVPITQVFEVPCAREYLIVDLPGIPTKSTGNEQFQPVMDFISKTVREEQCIILNVMSAVDDFETCQSVELVKKLDENCEKTITVITKCDLSPDFITKVESNKVGALSNYVYVRNRINDETVEEAEALETEIFKNNEQLSKIDNFLVGINSLTRKLIFLQLRITSKSLHHILQKTLNDLKMSGFEESPLSLLTIIKNSENVLYKLFISEDYDDYLDDIKMHCRARLVDRFENFLYVLKRNKPSLENNFLIDEIALVEERKWSCSSTLILSSVFNPILEKKFESVTNVIDVFVEEVCQYIELVVLRVLDDQSKICPQLSLLFKKSGEKMMEKIKKDFKNQVFEFLEVERKSVFTCDPGFITSWEQMKSTRSMLVDVVKARSEHKKVFNVPILGSMNVGHLEKFSENSWQLAYDIKMKILAYWEVIAKRFVDYTALNLMLLVHKMVNGGMTKMMLIDFQHEGKDGKKLDEESLLVKHEELKNRIKSLNEVKKFFEKMLEEIAHLL